jgi:hypothetical protein
MEHHATSPSTIITASHNTFFVRFRRNLVLEIKSFLRTFRIVFNLFNVVWYGFLLFLFGFDTVQQVAKILFPIIAIYIIVTYCTLLPTYSVIFFVAIPMKWTGRILSIAVVYAFFTTFLI